MKQFFSAANVGISGVDLQSVETYAGETLDVRNDFLFRVVINVTNVGGGANGLFDVLCEFFDPAGSADMAAFDLGTDISSKATGEHVIVFGEPITAKVSGGITIGSAIDLLKIGYKMRLSIDVTEANNGTSSVASVRLVSTSRRELSSSP